MFDDRDKRPLEEQPKEQPKPDTSIQKEYDGEQSLEKGDRLPNTDPNQN